MLTGQLILNGNKFTVFQEEVKNKRRVDICLQGAMFNVDVDKILCSVITGNNEKRKGNYELYEAYLSIIKDVENSNAVQHKEIKLDANKDIVQVTTASTTNIQYLEEKVNMKTTKLGYVSGENMIVLQDFLPSSDINLNPIDPDRYTTVDIIIAKTSDIEVPYYTAKQLQRMFPLEHLKKKNHFYIEDNDEAFDLCKKFKFLNKETPIGFDLETTTLDMHQENPDGKITGAIISPDLDTSYYFPFFQEKTNNLDLNIFEDLVKSIAHTEVTAHNKSFEEMCLMKYGVSQFLTIKHDSMLTAKVATGMALGERYDLKTKAEEISGNKFLELPEVFKGESKNIKFNVLPRDVIMLYACPDGYNTLLVQQYYQARLTEKQRWLLKYVENPLTEVKAYSQYWGIYFDKGGLLETKQYQAKDAEILKDAFKRSVNTNININSGDQLEDVIYNRLKAPAKVFTKSGKRSTGKGALNFLSQIPRKSQVEQHIPDIPSSRLENGKPVTLIKGKDLEDKQFPQILILQEYKKLSKELTTYYDRFTEHPYSEFHTWVNQYGARSGRQSSPLHQMPKTITKYVKPITDDFLLLDADWSQVELRILFYLAGQKDLFKMCQDPEADLHRIVGSQITGLPPYLISDAIRKLFKTVNFGTVYGISAHSLTKTLYGLNFTKEQFQYVESNMLAFFTTLKRVAYFFKQQEQFLLRNECVYTMFGRKRSLPKINDEDLDRKTKASLIRQGNNTPIQGTGADLLKLSEIKVYREFKKRGWTEPTVETPYGLIPKARPLISVHDEMLIEYHKSIPEYEIFEIMIDAMLYNLGDVMPLYPSMGIGSSWKEAKGDDNSLPIPVLEHIIKDKVVFTGSTKDRVKQTIELKNKLETQKLNEYMASILQETRDVDEVAKRITHPVYTFYLTGRYPNKKYKEDQEGLIRYAAEQYIKELDEKGQVLPEGVVLKEVELSKNEIPQELREEIEESYEQLAPDGNILKTNFDVEEEEQESGLPYEDASFMYHEVYEQSSYVIEALDTIAIDLSGIKQLTKDFLGKLDATIRKHHTPNGLMQVLLLLSNGKIITTEFKIEYAKDIEDEINTLVKEKMDELQEL